MNIAKISFTNSNARFGRLYANAIVFFLLRLWAQIFFSGNLSFTNASLQNQKLLTSPSIPTKSCDKLCFNDGICQNGNCICPPGWTGAQCESCFGRVKKNSTSRHIITDGPVNYSALSRCIWIIEKDVEDGPGPLLFTLDDFFTECCWDQLYIYDGNGVYNNLIAAFSGSIPTGTEIMARSGQAIVYFISDIAFNLPGFNISYVYGQCSLNCSDHGQCMPDGTCHCDRSYAGSYCEYQVCLADGTMNGQTGPCKNRAKCQNDGKCGCTKYSHGDNCQELILNPVWDIMLPENKKDLFYPRASHKAALLNDEIWLFGGYFFQENQSSKRKRANELINYNIQDKKFNLLNTTNSPSPRYDHSVLYVFGGVIKQNTITNEFWMIVLSHGGSSKWTMLFAHNESPFSMPMAVAGHTAHVIGNEMYVFFGYNPYEGFALIYGGFMAPYAITDELLLYDVNEQSWTQLESAGVPLFRHTAVILEGIMLIVGGNSHNESTKIRGISDCYSNKILAFDTVCQEWLKISIRDTQMLSSRYGHSAVADSKNMYIIGGFTGTMHNDILKFTPANCDNQATTAEECENTANGIRCVFINKTCKKALPDTTYVQSFLSFIKATGDSRQQENCTKKRNRAVNACSDIKECTECVFQKSCGWCESTQNCLRSDTSYGLLTDGSQCLLGSKPRKTTIKSRTCSLASNCFACKQLKHCTWFSVADAKHACVSLADEAMLIEEHREHVERLYASVGSGQTQLLSQAPPQSPARTTDNNNLFPQQLLDGFRQQNNSCPLPCAFHDECSGCVAAQCMWCPSTRRCVAMDTYMISFPYGQCQAWITAANTNHACQLG